MGSAAHCKQEAALYYKPIYRQEPSIGWRWAGVGLAS